MSDLQDEIVEAVIRAKKPLSATEVIALDLGGSVASDIYMALHRLHKAKRLLRVGDRGAFSYTMPDRAPPPALPVAVVPKMAPLQRRGRPPNAVPVRDTAPAPHAVSPTSPVGDALAWLRQQREKIDIAIAAIEALSR